MKESQLTQEKKSYNLKFEGSGSEYFKILIANLLLTIVTLGIYAPWAKANRLKYIYANTALNDDHFSFHGLGKELFIGLLKISICLVIIFAIFFVFMFFELYVAGSIFLFILYIPLLPLSIHGSFRYRMSRTSLRGIRFGYRGDRNALFSNTIKWYFLSLITLGIYSSWMQVNLSKYTLSHVRYGDVHAKYEADGMDLFIIILIGGILTPLTLGIYLFWYIKDLFAFYIDNLYFEKDGKQLRLKSTATGGDFFKLLVVNFLLTVFTLGFGYAWAEVRLMKFLMEKIQFEGDLDLSDVQQTEENFTDATGESALDFFDFNLF